MLRRFKVFAVLTLFVPAAVKEDVEFGRGAAIVYTCRFHEYR